MKKNGKYGIVALMLSLFTQKALCAIKDIPEGKVATYGRLACLAGKPRGARQISRLLHSMSQKHNLPWHRVVNSQGRISLRPSRGFELQKALLESEGVKFSQSNTIDLKVYLWDNLNEKALSKVKSTPDLSLPFQEL